MKGKLMDARSNTASISDLGPHPGAGHRVMSGYAAAVLLFISGCAALIDQVIWIKQLSLVVGVEVFAITTAISAFFGGLALGGLLFGRWADGTSRPIRLYAVLEASISITGVATTLALARTAPLFAAVESDSSLLAWAMVFALVGIPPLFMGGTLPVLVRALTRGPQNAGRVGGRLYAANTAGAIGGALAPIFLL